MSYWIFEPNKPPVEYLTPKVAPHFDEGTFAFCGGVWLTIVCFASNGILNHKMWIEVEITGVPKHLRATALMLE